MKIPPVLMVIILFLSGCANQTGTPSPSNAFMQIIDAAGRQVDLPLYPERVVALTSSLAGIWLEAGGNLVGVSSDAFEEQALRLDEGTIIVGSVKEPSAEILVSLEPELVILSPEITGHKQLSAILDQLKIPHVFITSDTFADYLDALELFTTLTGEVDNFSSYGVDQQKQIEKYIANCKFPSDRSTALVLRAFSSGVKAKADGIVPTEILDDYGIVNIARQQNSLLEDLSLEKILEEDPDYIFIVFMGDDTEKIQENLETSLTGNPAWAALNAVQNEEVHFLPKELFHFKPNGRWTEAYGYLYEIVCEP